MMRFLTANGNFVRVETLSGSASGAWYSDDRDTGDDHFVAFNLSGLNGYGDNSWVIAFEDLRGLGDRDYQDLVAVVTEVAPIPDAPTLLLLGSAMMGAGVFRRRKVRARRRELIAARETA